jgi:hypothetical protein
VKKYRKKHIGIASNIHSLETRGLSQCPDRGDAHFKRYIALGICAYNLVCIGRKLQSDYKSKKYLLKKTA